MHRIPPICDVLHSRQLDYTQLENNSFSDLISIPIPCIHIHSGVYGSEVGEKYFSVPGMALCIVDCELCRNRTLLLSCRIVYNLFVCVFSSVIRTISDASQNTQYQFVGKPYILYTTILFRTESSPETSSCELLNYFADSVCSILCPFNRKTAIQVIYGILCTYSYHINTLTCRLNRLETVVP